MVKNWQIKRDMEYPYEESRPDRQFSAVFDLNKCIACQTCTIACKTTWTSGRGQEYMFWNNVESKPFGGYPLGYDVKILEKLGVQEWDGDVYTGKTLFDAHSSSEQVLGYLPDDMDWAHPNIGEDEAAKPIEKSAHYSGTHDNWAFYLPRICNHCTYPACLASCPRKAIYKRKEDGIVLVDQERCRGYRECMKGCPYKKVLFNTTSRISEKCIACYPLVEKGFETRCIETCIGKIRLQGWVSTPEKAREDFPLDYMVHVKKIALPLFPQFGLEPNIYYVPPVHVPRNFLHMLFGPGVDNAIETYRHALEDNTFIGLLALVGSSNRILHTFKVSGDYAAGFNENGEEILRVPIHEPIFIRDYFDKVNNAYRQNVG